LKKTASAESNHYKTGTEEEYHKKEHPRKQTIRRKKHYVAPNSCVSQIRSEPLELIKQAFQVIIRMSHIIGKAPY